MARPRPAIIRISTLLLSKLFRDESISVTTIATTMLTPARIWMKRRRRLVSVLSSRTGVRKRLIMSPVLSITIDRWRFAQPDGHALCFEHVLQAACRFSQGVFDVAGGLQARTNFVNQRFSLSNALAFREQAGIFRREAETLADLFNQLAIFL